MSMNIGRAALMNSQIAIDNVGQNIAHANDPNYAKRRVDSSTSSNGFINVRIEQIINASLEKDILREQAAKGFYDSQKEVLTYIENTVNELTDNDLSSVLDSFYGSLEQLSLNPHDVPLRQAVVEEASKVADLFQLTSSSLTNVNESVDRAISDMADIVNSSLEQIAEINIQIAKKEGHVTDQPANDLRDKRTELLNELSKMMNITSTEMSNGAILVQSDGRTLVFQSEARTMYVDRSTGVSQLRYNSDHAYVKPSGGSLGGYIKARDEILTTQRSELDTIARNFIWNMNKAHNTGRGLEGVTSATATTQVSSNYMDKALNAIETDGTFLADFFKPENGVMSIEMRNETTGTSQVYDVAIRLVGDDQTSLIDLRDQLGQIENLNASIDNLGRLKIDSTSGYSFFVKEDTSNVSSFLGLNNLYEGSDAGSIRVKETITEDVRFFAAAKSANPGDNSNIAAMTATKTVDIGNNTTFMQSYENFVSGIASQVSRTSALHANQERILDSVIEKRQSFSGVNLDEEAANLLRYQQSYQAAARYITVQNELLELLFSIA